MKPIIFFLVGFTSVMIIFGVIYFFVKWYEHRKTRDRRIAACKHLGLDKVDEELFEDLANRTFVFYYSFVLQNIIGIICDLFSFVYSVVTFVQIANDDANIIVSLFAILFVIMIIYLKPHRRSSQYLNAWRAMESLSQDTLHKLELNTQPQSAGSVQNRPLFEEVTKRRAQIEASISTDTE